MAEQAPNPASRVTLTDRRDALGLPRLRLEWRLSPDDVDGIIRSQQIVKTAIEAAGLGRVISRFDDGLESPATLQGGWHHMGTTRMHTDPLHGVVDADCRVHGVSNLYVAGSSVFPTGGYANPTLTLIALALRLADTLKTRLKNTGPVA
jgi:choline dehydrogenase-like flavoprotein